MDWLSAVANIAQNIGNWIFGKQAQQEQKEEALEAYARARRDAVEDFERQERFMQNTGNTAPSIARPVAPMVQVHVPTLDFRGIHQESGNEVQNQLAEIRADVLENKENREFIESVERRTLNEQQLKNLKLQYDQMVEQNKKNKIGAPTDKDPFIFRLAFALAEAYKNKSGQTPASMKDLADMVYNLFESNKGATSKW